LEFKQVILTGKSISEKEMRHGQNDSRSNSPLIPKLRAVYSFMAFCQLISSCLYFLSSFSRNCSPEFRLRTEGVIFQQAWKPEMSSEAPRRIQAFPEIPSLCGGDS